MNQNNPKILQFNLSGLGFWVALVAIAWLLGAIGLGWLVKSFVIIVGLIVITPAIALIGFRFWVKRNLVEDDCPVCGYEFTGFNRTEFQCPSCKEPLKADKKHFVRLTPPGTIDVQAVEVSAKQIED